MSDFLNMNEEESFGTLGEFESIGQSDEDLDIDIFANDGLLEVIDVRALNGFEYPAMVISGIRFKDTLRVLQNVRKESYRLFDVWVDLGEGNPPVKQGSLPADIETLLAMRYLGLDVTLYLDEDSVETLDLHDIATLENFI